MRSPAVLAKIGIMGSLVIGLSSPVLASDDYDCTQLMYEHGLATSAQAYCGYESYNESVINKAAQCMALAEQHGKSSQLEGALRAGLSDFQMEYEEASSKTDICRAFSDEFSLFVNP